MKLLKILLLPILLFVLFIIYNVSEQTSNFLLLENRNSHEGQHAIYKNGKQIYISNKEYDKLKSISSANRDNTHYKSSKSQVSSHRLTQEYNKKENIDKLKLTGIIEKGINYKITTFYESESKGVICGSTAFGLGFGSNKGLYRTTSGKKISYKPTIKNDYHNIEIPLSKFRPVVGCKYHLNSVNMKIYSNDEDRRIPKYLGYFRLFIPSDRYNLNSVNPHKNISVGSKIDIECIKSNTKSFISKCHLKSSSDTYFTAQKLLYSNYKINITTISQDIFDMHKVLKSQEYKNKIYFTKNISTHPEIYKQNLSYFTKKIEDLNEYHNILNQYLHEIRNKLNKILKTKKNDLSAKSITRLKSMIKSVHRSIQANVNLMEINKKLIFTKKEIKHLQELNNKIKIDKIFLNNEYYKYQILHYIDITKQSAPYYVESKLISENNKIKKILRYGFLTCNTKGLRKKYFGLCIELDNIFKKDDMISLKKVYKKIQSLGTVLLLKSQVNILQAIRVINK